MTLRMWSSFDSKKMNVMVFQYNFLKDSYNDNAVIISQVFLSELLQLVDKNVIGLKKGTLNSYT